MLVTVYKAEFTSSKTLITFVYSLNSTITNFSLKYLTRHGSHKSHLLDKIHFVAVRGLTH